MSGLAKISDLSGALLRETDPAKCLQIVSQFLLENAKSRNVLITGVNEELGTLEMRCGFGKDWNDLLKSETFSIQIQDQNGIVAHVATTGEFCVANNVLVEPLYKTLFESTRSELAIPIHDRSGRIQGVLNVESDQLNSYDDDTINLCKIVASLLALVFERQEHEAHEEALIEIGQALDRAQTEEALLSQVIHVAGEVLRFQAFSIFIYDSQSDSFVLRDSVGILRDQIGELRYRKGEGCTGWVCEHGEVIRLDSPIHDPRWRGKYLEFPSEQIASFMAVPILSRNRTIGVLRVLRRKSDKEFVVNHFTDAEQRILEAMADQIAVGLENIRAIEKLVSTERMVAWGEMSAKSSHMIGNRIFALKGDVNELKHILSEEVLARKELTDIQQSLFLNVTRIEEILQDFRDFLTATKIEKTETDLAVFIREAAAEFFPRRSQIELKLEISEELPLVRLDQSRLKRALAELIENSVNFMEEGSITIASGIAERQDIQLANLNPRSKYIKIEVTDSGPGVTVDMKDLIFQPFYSSRVKGMGLGLSIVRGILEAHGGTIVETGSEGTGATFMMLLPVLDRQATR